LDNSKLQALRLKYANTKGGDIFDPEFAAVAAQMFSSAERRKWPFADPATLLDMAFRPDVLTLPDFGGLDVALVGVPMDLGVTNRAGARLGPRAVRAVERIARTNMRCASRRQSTSRLPTLATCPCKAGSARPMPRGHRGVLHPDLRR
jgi:hypothetical protein